MVTLTEAFCKLHPVNVLVIGDFILDVYTKGKVERISPEAPVPVLHVYDESCLPGGAGNVVLNLQSLGAKVSMIGRIGDDEDGCRLLELFEQAGLPEEGIFTQFDAKTPMKNRLIAGGQQLMRTDYETITPLNETLENEVLVQLEVMIPSQDVIAVSDYAKGFLSDKVLAKIFKIAREHYIPVIVDPKGSEFMKYAGAFLIKPNNSEAYAAADIDRGASIEKVSEVLFEKYDMEHLLITRSEKGMALFSGDGSLEEFQTPKKDVLDVTGAGDTALAMITFAVANGLSLPHAIRLANISSGLAIEKLGCANVRLPDIAKVLLEREPESKIFDQGSNFFVMEKALEGHQIFLLDLSETDEMTTQLFHLVRKIGKGHADIKRIAYLPGSNRKEDFVQLLVSMHEIDFVLLSQEGYETLTKHFNDVEILGEKAVSEIDWKRAVVT